MKNKFIVLLLAFVMIVASICGAFAGTESSEEGKVSKVSTTVKVSQRLIVVNGYSTIIYKTSAGTIKGNKIICLQKGDKVIITTSNGVAYRWVKTCKVIKNKNGKVTWKKVKNASYYLLKITKNGKTTYKKVKSTSYKAKKGTKIRVRPLIKKNGKTYSGAFCKTVKVK